MPCDPLNNNLNYPTLGPPPALFPFGIPFSPPQIPLPNFSLPEGIPEDLLALLDQLLANLPGGPFVPNPHNFMKDIWDALASLLNQIAPYLGLYRFLQALLNMVLCILDVLCSLMSPRKTKKALKKLFKRCLPAFLNLFPWLALIAMIIALLLLLLALIEYIINRILDLIKQLIENLIVLAEAAQLSGEEEILAGARKIAYLLCMIEQLFALLIAFQAIMAIIQALAGIQGRSTCASGSSNKGDDSECCTEEVCPPFIKNNEIGLSGTLGQLLYYNEHNNDVMGLLGVNLVMPAARNESWQFTDLQVGKQYEINDIITPIDGNIFWPDGLVLKPGASLKKVPYLLDMTLKVNPSIFGHVDFGGERKFVISDCIVTQKPFIGIKEYDNDINTSLNTITTGTVFIEGGLVYEENGSEYIVSGEQATLNTFIHHNSELGVPVLDDGYYFNNIEYTLRYNHEALAYYDIITIGCDPELAIETEIANLVATDIRAVVEKIGNLPDIEGTVSCLTAALAKFRQDVSEATAEEFQTTAVGCLTNLQSQTLNVYESAVTAGTSIYKSTVELNPDLQFVNNPIDVKVVLKDPGGTVISLKIPSAMQEVLSAKIQGNVTVGEISDFKYDGYEAFTAQITSKKAGSGELTVSFDSQILSLVLGQDDDTVSSSIASNILTYQFVGHPVDATGEGAPRRDEGDIARGV